MNIYTFKSLRVWFLVAMLTVGACSDQPGVSVENENFRWDLDLSTFQAVGVMNKLTGEYCPLGQGEELAIYLDTSDARIELGPWKRTVTSKFAGFGSTPPERDPGYEKGFFSFEVDDVDWESSPVVLADRSRHVWGRTRFHLPDAAGKTVHIVLGGHGLNDADWMRVFLNGTEIGTRVESGFWREGRPTLHKFVSVVNGGTEPVRVLDVDLGNYDTGGTASEGGEGFPVHVNDQIFFGIAHPAGLVQGGKDGSAFASFRPPSWTAARNSSSANW